MRRRMMLVRRFRNSAEASEFLNRFAFARVGVFMRIGRWQLFLILKHGKNIPPGWAYYYDKQASNTSALPTSLRCSAPSEPIIASTQSRSRSRLWICPGVYRMKFHGWEVF